MNKTSRVLVVGLGVMGQTYLKKLVDTNVDIVAYDIDPAKEDVVRALYGERVLISKSDEVVASCDMAIIATTTPSHAQLMIDLMECGIKHMLCEKPLVFRTDEAVGLEIQMGRMGAQIFTAFVMNFSPAILYVIELMKAENLVMTEGSTTWGKNRCGDTRPTPGNLEDETVHGMGILHNLCKINQSIENTRVSAMLTHPKFANDEAQSRAHALDPSFSERVNASTMGMEVIRTNKGVVPCSFYSSFIASEQVRQVTVVLADANDPTSAVYSIKMTFDKERDGVIRDELTLTSLHKKRVDHLTWKCDKIQEQTMAFLRSAVVGIHDPHLASFEEAWSAAKFAEAVLRSNTSGGILTTV